MQTDQTMLGISDDVYNLEYHPIANIFPLMDDAQITALREDISLNGLLKPIILFDNKILDGRNRLCACRLAGIRPKIDVFDGTLIDALAYSWSLNHQRRHLNSSQAAICEVERAQLSNEYADQLKIISDEAGQQRDQTKKLERDRLGRLVSAKETIDAQDANRDNKPVVKFISQQGKSAYERKTKTKRAKIVGTNRIYLADAEKIIASHPEYIKPIKNGDMTITQAKKEIRKVDNKKNEQDILSNIGDNQDWTVTSEQDVVSCNALITDPPYGILDEPWEPSDLKQFTKDWVIRWNECKSDFFVCFWSQKYLWTGKEWFDQYLTNYKFQQLLIWHYPNNKKPQSRQGFKQTWEPILFYRRNGCEKKLKLGGGEWGEGLNDFDCHVAAVPQSNFNGSEMKQHPAQKPVSVFKWLINVLTEPGEMVCDPFCGSGSSGIASRQLKRSYHGIEIDPDYIKSAKGRIATYGTN